MLFSTVFTANLRHEMVHEAERRTATEIAAIVIEKLRDEGRKPPIILHGGIGEGKTTAAIAVCKALIEQGTAVGGIVSPRIIDKNETVGYSIRNLLSGEESPFATLDPPGVAIGKYYIQHSGIDFAQRAIDLAAHTVQVVLVDEVGRLELAGGGHAPALRTLLRSRALPILIVRSQFVTQVVDRFSIDRYEAFAVDAGCTVRTLRGGGR